MHHFGFSSHTWLLIWVGTVIQFSFPADRSHSHPSACLYRLLTSPSPHTHLDRYGLRVPWPHCIPVPLCQVRSVTVVFPPLPTPPCLFSSLSASTGGLRVKSIIWLFKRAFPDPYFCILDNNSPSTNFPVLLFSLFRTNITIYIFLQGRIYRAEIENRSVCVCMFMVGRGWRKGGRGVYRNSEWKVCFREWWSHPALWKQLLFFTARKKQRRQRTREEMQLLSLRVCVCVFVSASQDFRSYLIALHANETSQTCTQGHKVSTAFHWETC